MRRPNKLVALGALVGMALAVGVIFAIQALGAAGSGHSETFLGDFSALSNSDLATPPPAILAEFDSIHPGVYTDARTAAAGMYIASWNGSICAVIIDGASGCTDSLESGVWFHADMARAYDSPTTPFDVHIYGLASDGISAIEIAKTDGTHTSIPVENNMFRGALPGTEFSDVTAVNAMTPQGAIAIDPHFPDLQRLG